MANVVQAPQQELAEPHHRLDDAEHRLHGLLPERIGCTARLRLEGVAHLFDVACRPGERRGLLETVEPVRMMGVAARSLSLIHI